MNGKRPRINVIAEKERAREVTPAEKAQSVKKAKLLRCGKLNENSCVQELYQKTLDKLVVQPEQRTLNVK